MGAAARISRALVLIAAVVCGLPRSARALIVEATVEPGTIVPVGTVITLTMTLTGEWPYPNGLGNLAALPGAAASGCSGDSPLDGWYGVYPDQPLIVSAGQPSSTSLHFLYNYESRPHWAQWSFTAVGSGAVSFSAFAYDKYVPLLEGCGNPSPATCPFPFPMGGTSGCSFATVTITSTLTGHLAARASASVGSRPAGQAFIGDVIEVVMSVTNTGAGVVTPATAVASTAFTTTDVLLALVSAPALPGPLPANASAMLTWTYSITGATPGGIAEFWANVDGAFDQADPLSVVSAPITVSVTVLIDPDGAGPLPALPASQGWYMANDEMWVQATIRNPSSWGLEVDPVISVADWDGHGVPDFEQVGARDPAGPWTLNALTGVKVFTWKYRVNRSDGEYYQVCTPDPLNDMQWTIGVRGLNRTISLPMGKAAVGIVPEIPSVAETGTSFPAYLSVTNLTGRPVVLDASATVYLQAVGTSYVAIVGAPPAGGLTFTATGQVVQLQYTVTATAEGLQWWDGGIAYAENAYPGYYPCSASIGAVATQVVGPSPLVPVLVSTTNVINSNSDFGFVLSVFNASSCTATLSSLDPALSLDERPIPASLISAAYSSTVLPCTVPPGATIFFTYTATARGCGEEDWSGTMTGEWGADCRPGVTFSRPFRSNKVRIRQQAVLWPGSASWTLPQSSVVETGTFDVVCSVAPGSENSIDNFNIDVQPHVSSTSTVVSLLSGPTPAIPTVLAGCGACVANICWNSGQSFTWTFQADSRGAPGGKVWFTFTASGVDIYDRTPVQSLTSTGAVRILRPSVISVSAMNDPDEATDCVRSTEMDVSVEGDTPVIITSIGISASDPAKCAIAGPVSCCGVTVYSGTQAWNWSYTPAGEGCVTFTVSAVGIETTMGGIVYAEATTTDPRCFTRPELGGSFKTFVGVREQTPWSATPFALRLTVTNNGQVRADGVWISDWSVSGSTDCAARAATAPVLTATVWGDTSGGLYGCGGGATFIWDFIVPGNGVGGLALTVTVTGVRPDTGAPLSFCDRFCFAVASPVLVNIVSSPPSVVRGRVFDVALVIDNRSSELAHMTLGETLLKSSSGDLVAREWQVPSLDVGAGSRYPLSVKVTSLPGAATGSDRLFIPANAFSAKYEYLNVKGLPVPEALPVVLGDPADITVLPDHMVFEIGQNPWHPLKGPLSIRYVAPESGKLTLKAYSLGGELVRTIIDEGSAALEGTVLWDGRNRDGQPVSAGIYLLRFEGKGLKVTKKLAVVK